MKTTTIRGTRVPVTALAAEVYDAGRYLKRNFTRADLTESGKDDPDEFAGTDARLRVHGGYWQLLTGSADYDQDHRGAWGAGSIPWGCTHKEARDIARDLIEDCANMAADMGDES